MSLRKFMHHRNIYKEEPNFRQLAISYPEFRKATVNDLAGKVKVNFKNDESLRILAKTLLKHDFGIEVDIPKGNLVPALPLLLNYILWIEDLLWHVGMTDLENAHGIDIGTGAISVYPLLFSKMFKSKMTCTDIHPDTVTSAINNIEKNDLQGIIKVILVEKDSILNKVLQGNEKFSFLMCNPPFFETDKGLGRKVKQEPPRNAPTGIDNELKVEGGEKDFVLRLIHESIEHKDKVEIYTTMFGQKSSLAFVRNELKKKGIVNSIWTEFCQGYTKRWGLAWTFLPKSEVDLTTAPVIRTRTEISKIRKNKSMEIVFPPKENLSSLEEVIAALKKWLTELQIKMKEIQLIDEEYPCWGCELTGYSDTWSHARRKRRMAMREEALKKQRLENSNVDEIQELPEEKEPTELKNTVPESTHPLLVCTLLVSAKNETNDEKSQSSEDDSDKGENDSNEIKMLRISMLFESGHGGKLSLETLRQYLVNKLSVREFFHKQQRSKPNKKKRRKKKIL